MIFRPLYLKIIIFKHVPITRPSCLYTEYILVAKMWTMEPGGTWVGWVGVVAPFTTHSPPITPIVFPRGQVGRRVPADVGNQVWGAQINTDTLILHCDARWLMCDTLTISVHCNSRVIAGCDGHLVANTHWCSGPGRWKHLNANCCCETLNKG